MALLFLRNFSWRFFFVFENHYQCLWTFLLCIYKILPRLSAEYIFQNLVFYILLVSKVWRQSGQNLRFRPKSKSNLIIFSKGLPKGLCFGTIADWSLKSIGNFRSWFFLASFTIVTSACGETCFRDLLESHFFDRECSPLKWLSYEP